MKKSFPPRVRQVLEDLAAALRAFGIDRDDRVVLAYSGGLDSAALLWALCNLHPHRRPVVEAICVDHGLRADSGEHARRAIEVARSMGVDGRVLQVACEGEGGVEAAARKARYAALARVAEGRPILTAHTADDQAETVLYRLAKGAGLRGLGGIRPEARIEGGRVLRPFLGVRRSALEEVVGHAKIPVVEDATNHSRRYVRNRIRMDVLPALEAAVPGARGALARAARLAQHDEDYLSRRAARWSQRLRRGDGWDARGLARLPRALASRVVRDAVVAARGRPPTARQVEQILELLPGSGEFRLCDDWVAVCRQRIFSVRWQPRGRG